MTSQHNEERTLLPVRMSHPGCQSSGWCCEILRQIFLPTSKRPVGQRNMNSGGLYGYCAGRIILPWYTPPENGVSSGPRSTKCQSNKLSSTGCASKSSEGSERCVSDTQEELADSWCLASAAQHRSCKAAKRPGHHWEVSDTHQLLDLAQDAPDGRILCVELRRVHGQPSPLFFFLDLLFFLGLFRALSQNFLCHHTNKYLWKRARALGHGRNADGARRSSGCAGAVWPAAPRTRAAVPL